MIEISSAAVREIKRIQLSRQKPESHFRLAIKSGGCSGLLYVLDLTENIETSDRTEKSNGVAIVVDKQSYSLIESLKIDYSEDLMGGGFRFDNPKAFNTCGCGYSFAAIES